MLSALEHLSTLEVLDLMAKSVKHLNAQKQINTTKNSQEPRIPDSHNTGSAISTVGSRFSRETASQ